MSYDGYNLRICSFVNGQCPVSIQYLAEFAGSRTPALFFCWEQETISMSQSNKKSISKDDVPVHQVQTETGEKDRKDKQETDVVDRSFDEDQKENNNTPDGPAPRGMDA